MMQQREKRNLHRKKVKDNVLKKCINKQHKKKCNIKLTSSSGKSLY